jgi:hypothetical protein
MLAIASATRSSSTPFNTSMLGLRAGSGVTVGVLGAVIGVEWSLALSAAAVVVVAVDLLVVDVGTR